MKKVLEQIGKIRISSHHLKNYETVDANIKDILTKIHANGIFESRAKAKVTEMLPFLTIDMDGTKEAYDQMTFDLMIAGISFIAFASPSRKKAMKSGLFKTRIVVPCIGEWDSTRDERGIKYSNFKLQFLQTLYNAVGMETLKLIDTGVVESARLFYPPVMRKITEPYYAEKKPKDFTYHQALLTVDANVGEPLKIATEYNDEVLAMAFFKKREDGSYAPTDKESVYVPDDTIVRFRGEPLGTLEEVIYAYGEGKIGDRCDCPFYGKEQHSNGTGYDYGIITEGGIVCKGHTAQDKYSRSHAHLILQKASTRRFNPNDFEVL